MELAYKQCPSFTLTQTYSFAVPIASPWNAGVFGNLLVTRNPNIRSAEPFFDLEIAFTFSLAWWHTCLGPNTLFSSLNDSPPKELCGCCLHWKMPKRFHHIISLRNGRQTTFWSSQLPFEGSLLLASRFRLGFLLDNGKSEIKAASA